MSVQIPGRRADTRVEQILRDPKTYFADARKKARAEVEAEKQAEKVEKAQRRGWLSRRTA